MRTADITILFYSSNCIKWLKANLWIIIIIMENEN